MANQATQQVRTGLISLTMLALAACMPSNRVEQEELRLPTSINAVMASLINHSADPIWVAAWQNPQSQEDWRELEHLARQLALGGTLITIPGTGPVDEQWTDRPSWQDYAGELSDAATEALQAAQARDVEGIATAGDRIVEVCESCHSDFKPGQPTMNIYGELSPTARDF